MANVSSNGIRGCAAEIDNVISITQSTADKTQEVCNEISSANEILQSYDNAIVKGSHGFTKNYSKANNQNGWIDKEYVNRWKITGLDTSGTVNTLNEMANEVSNIVSTVKSEVASIEEIATAIDGYIGSINAQLSDLDIRSITPEILANAYLAIGKDGVAKTNLATNGEDINNRNFIDYNDIKDNGLSNTRLTFVLQDDGSYRVYSNGKETEFYTTGLAAAFYQKTLKREVQKTYSSKSGNNQTNSKENNSNKMKIKDGSNIVNADDVSNSVKEEIAGISATSKNTSQTRGAAAMAGAPTTGNRNIGNLNSEVPVTSKNTSQTRGAAAMAGAPTTGNRNIGNLNSEVPVSQRIDNNGKITLNSGEKIYSGDIMLTEDNTSYLIKNENTGKWIQYDSAGNMITNSFSPVMDYRGEISLDLDSSNLKIK